MIIGIGVDIVHPSRISRWLNNPGLLERYFHPEEVQVSLAKGRGAALSLAARFAAKEAFGKALGTGMEGLVLKDILLKNLENGQPVLEVSGTALAALNRKKTGAAGTARIHVSLSHEKDIAIAMLVLEGSV